MIAMGHNYGTGYPTAPWGGILAMIVFCIVCGTFLSYLTIRTGSALPAAIGHGALNAFAAAPAYFMASGVYNPFLALFPPESSAGPVLLSWPSGVRYGCETKKELSQSHTISL